MRPRLPRRLLLTALLFLPFLTFAAAAASAAPTATAGTSRLNVLFIIADDLTSTALSCYGNEIIRTPNIDAIAATCDRTARG